MSHHVTDEDAEPILGKLEKIKKIASDGCRGPIIMSESEGRMPGNIVPGEGGVFTREQSELEFPCHVKIRFELSVLGRKRGSGDPESISFFLQRVFHPLDGGKILVDPTDADDF